MTFTQATLRETDGGNHRGKGRNPKSLSNIPAISLPAYA